MTGGEASGRGGARLPAGYFRLRSQRGDTMVEVLIAALLVALISGAIFTGYGSVAGAAAGERERAQASALAETDQARLHGLTLNDLVSSGSGTGNYAAPAVTIGGTSYDVTSSSQFMSASGTPSCTTDGTSTADEVQTTSTVSWPDDSAAGGPVEVHGLITPQEGGALIARVVDSGGAPIAGAVVSLSGGPSSPGPLTTDSVGCVEFGGLSGGTYTATAVISGVSTSESAPPVVATRTSTVTLTPAGDGGISATFYTTYGGSVHPSTADQVTANSSASPGVYDVFGTASTLASNTYASTVNSGSVYGAGNYTTYAGSCAGDYSSDGSQVAAVSPGTTADVSLPLPAMIVDVYGDDSSLLTTAPLVTITDDNSGCSDENYPATQVPTPGQGALVDPGQPYGDYTVCASSGGVENTADVANTSYTDGNVVSIYLGAGSPGLTSGSCT